MRKKTVQVIILSAISMMSLSFFRQWKIDTGYSIAIDNFDIAGKFEKFGGQIVFDENNLGKSSFKVRVEVKSLSTGNILKTRSALGEEWFNASDYPAIDFVSTKIEKVGTVYKATGNLTIKGITKQLSIPFSFVNQEKGGVFSGEFVVNRVDFEVGSEESDVEYEVKVMLKVPVKQL